jgi:hypothetical protein
MSSWPARSAAERWSTIEAAHDVGVGVDEAPEDVAGAGAVPPGVVDGGSGTLVRGDGGGAPLGGGELQLDTARTAIVATAPTRPRLGHAGRWVRSRVQVT